MPDVSDLSAVRSYGAQRWTLRGRYGLSFVLEILFTVAKVVIYFTFPTRRGGRGDKCREEKKTA